MKDYTFYRFFIMARMLNNWLQTQLSFNIFTDYRLLTFVVAVLIIVTLAAGLHPVIILSRFKPVNALKKQDWQPNTSRAIRSYACRPYAFGRYPLLSLT